MAPVSARSLPAAARSLSDRLCVLTEAIVELSRPVVSLTPFRLVLTVFRNPRPVIVLLLTGAPSVAITPFSALSMPRARRPPDREINRLLLAGALPIVKAMLVVAVPPLITAFEEIGWSLVAIGVVHRLKLAVSANPSIVLFVGKVPPQVVRLAMAESATIVAEMPFGSCEAPKALGAVDSAKSRLVTIVLGPALLVPRPTPNPRLILWKSIRRPVLPSPSTMLPRSVLVAMLPFRVLATPSRASSRKSMAHGLLLVNPVPQAVVALIDFRDRIM